MLDNILSLSFMEIFKKYKQEITNYTHMSMTSPLHVLSSRVLFMEFVLAYWI